MSRVNIKRVKVKKPKRKKKPSRKSLDRQCLKLWSIIIRFKGYCELCHTKIRKLNAHHIIGKKNYRLRWDLRNGLCACAGCHKLNLDSVEEDPQSFMDWMKENRLDDYRYLYNAKNEKWDGDYDTVLKYLTDNLPPID